jgi:two-component system KDP operon response regulator KdpE
VAELLARVRAHFRRRATASPANTSVVEFGDVKIDLTRRVVERAGAKLHLTQIEYRLLTHLTSHPECVLTHRQLLNAVWGPGHGEDTHYLRVYMGQLRRKIETDPAQPRHLLTETGIGYRFVP